MSTHHDNSHQHHHGHSVASHLRLDVAEYDKAIRVLVPHYDEMMATGVALLERLAPRSAHVLDLGAGTGRAAEAVLRALPETSVTLVDLDAAMLGVARERLAPFGARARFHHGSFLEALPPADAVIASLSLHHVPTMAAKTAVYRAIHACLPAGGAFLCLDATVSRDPTLQALTMQAWAAAMAAHGVDAATAHGHFAAWAQEDFYMPLADELAGLRSVGFAQPECFWRREPVTVFGARKD